MEIRGRQGSKLTGRMFAKQTDVLAEEVMEPETQALQLTPNLKIGALLWIDDLVSCVEGPTNQEKMLERVDVFAQKNKIQWGIEKCNVMQVGTPVERHDPWNFGENTIDACTEYKYLGAVTT